MGKVFGDNVRVNKDAKNHAILYNQVCIPPVNVRLNHIHIVGH